MTNQANQDDKFIDPDHERGAHERAEELFVHGLLGHLHDKDRQQKRIEAAMGVIASETPAPLQRALGHRHRRVRRVAAICAAMLLGALGVLLVMEMPGNSSSAYATVTAAMDAAKGPASERYELRLAHWPKDELPEKATGTLDNGAGGFFLSFSAPDGHTVKVGKDDKGEWGIRLDGSIEREHPRSAWPRWVEVGDDSLLGDSVDHLLESLLKDYALTSDGKQLLPGAPDGSKRFKHLHGDRKEGARKPQPDRVDLWIDSDTNVLERLEMAWPKPPEGRLGPRGGDRPAPDGARPDGAKPDGPREGGPDGDAPRNPSEGRDGPDSGPGPDGPEGVRPHDGPPPEGPDGDRPHDGPPGPEGGPDGPRHRRPPMDGMGPDGPRMRPRPDGMGPGPGGPGGPGGGPGAGFRPRVSRLILSRVDAPAFEQGWFSPEKHQ